MTVHVNLANIMQRTCYVIFALWSKVEFQNTQCIFHPKPENNNTF